jgi:hypothetical protein
MPTTFVVSVRATRFTHPSIFSRKRLAILVLLVLAALWAAVLVPPVVRARNSRAAGGTLRGSSYRLDVLRPASGPAGGSRRSHIPGLSRSGPGMTQSQRRRRDILVGLGGAAVVTFLLAVFTGVAAIWILHLLFDVLLAGYVILLLQIKKGAFAGGRGPSSRTIRAVPHRAPLASVGSRPAPRRSVPTGAHLPAGYGSSAPHPMAAADRRRSA